MNTSKLTARVLTMSLALAASACRPHAARGEDAADPGIPPTDVTPATTVAPKAEGKPSAPPRPQDPKAPKAPGFGASEVEHATREAEMAKRHAEVAKKAATLAERRIIVPGSMEDSRLVYGMFDSVGRGFDTPAILVTSPIDDNIETEWTEDLTVMEKLLREATGANGNAGDGPMAMGIKITALGGGRNAPMYLESAGVVYSMAVNWPLAPSEDADGAGATTRQRASAWTQAQMELKGGRSAERNRKEMRATFDAERLDNLVDAIVKVLPEATNFRHLKPDESVFITVLGANERGVPTRMTIKAKKSDIDAAAAGTLSAEAFKQRVAMRIG